MGWISERPAHRKGVATTDKITSSIQKPPLVKGAEIAAPRAVATLATRVPLPAIRGSGQRERIAFRSQPKSAPPPAPAATSAPRRAGFHSSHRSKRPAEKKKRAMVRPATAPDKTVDSLEQKNRRSDSGSDWCLRRRRAR